MSENNNRIKKILVMAWPLIIANSFWNLQLTIDRVFLGQLSTEALAAAVGVMGVFWVPMALLQQTSGYVIAFVAQYYGAKENEKIGGSVWQAFYVSVIGGILFLGINLFSHHIFALAGHSEKVQALEVDYYNSIAFSALPTALVAAISGFYTGLGRTRIVTTINLVGLLLNAFLDYTLIFGNWGFPKLGVVGAGYATSIATLGAAIYGLAILFTKENETLYKIRSSWKLDLPLLQQFLKYGIPSGLQFAFEGMAFTIFLMLMGKMKNGDAALAASSIAVTIMMLSILPSMGVAQSVMTLVGQHMGDNNPKEAEASTYGGIKISVFYMGIVAICFYVIPEFFIAWFKNSDNAPLWNETQSLAIIMLRLVAIFTSLDSIFLNTSFALKGAGDTRFVSIISLTLPWPLFVLPTFLMKDLPNAPVLSWVSVTVYAFMINLVLFLRFRGGKWKTMSVIHPTP
ncbi:MAG: MATE family efflux transporter [Leptospiraceae bacterium]|nr:MATE family efflux transporter [Leptospiraceae bacterium]